MTLEELKQYTKRAKDLEVAIYSLRQLIESYDKIANEQLPQEPVKRQVKKPEKPIKPTPHRSLDKDGVLGLSVIILFTLGIASFLILIKGWFLLIGFVCLVIYFASKLISEHMDTLQSDKELQISYEALTAKYPAALAEYEHELEMCEAEYSAAIESYHHELLQHTLITSKTKQECVTALESLIHALNAHYDSNIIFPKYRDLVAITTIDEYLSSGRCEALEGATGAYNLYEMELRQNIIIGQLSTIVSNLEQIRNNQYTLYQELHASNLKLAEITHELRALKQDTKLLTYLSELTAIATASPSYSYGMII